MPIVSQLFLVVESQSVDVKGVNIRICRCGYNLVYHVRLLQLPVVGKVLVVAVAYWPYDWGSGLTGAFSKMGKILQGTPTVRGRALIKTGILIIIVFLVVIVNIMLTMLQKTCLNL